MQYSYNNILIGCLVLQVAVDATVEVGELEYSAPSDACAPIAHPFFVPDCCSKNMVLINGTDRCDFMTKIKNARAAGFEAAILFDPFPESFNYSDITFPIERSEINMTVVLVSCEDGLKLQNYIFPESRKNNLFVTIEPTSSINLVVISVFAFVLCVPVVAALVLLVSVGKKTVKKYRNRVQGRENVANQDIQPVSDESESAHLLASESPVPNNARSTEELKNELVEALGSVNDVQGSELNIENTQSMIV